MTLEQTEPVEYDRPMRAFATCRRSKKEWVLLTTDDKHGYGEYVLLFETCDKDMLTRVDARVGRITGEMVESLVSIMVIRYYSRGCW